MSITSLMTPSLPPGSHYPRHDPQHPPFDPHLPAYPTHSLQHAPRPSRIPPSSSYPSNTPSISRPPAGSLSRQLPPLPNMPPSHSTSALQNNNLNRSDRHPNWDEFYRNGMPKEIIVIDDDSPAPASKRGKAREEPTPKEVAGNPHHATKKRRTGHTSAYDSTRDDYPAYSHARTYSQGESGSNTISTDRTTSLQTTAPTSLSSHGSAGATYIEEASVGQKRKRVTRQQIADEKRRKDIDILGDPNSTYIPPPKPPIKAKEVHVPSIKDVRQPLPV